VNDIANNLNHCAGADGLCPSVQTDYWDTVDAFIDATLERYAKYLPTYIKTLVVGLSENTCGSAWCKFYYLEHHISFSRSLHNEKPEDIEKMVAHEIAHAYTAPPHDRAEAVVNDVCERLLGDGY